MKEFKTETKEQRQTRKHGTFRTRISNIFFMMKCYRLDWRELNEKQLSLKDEIKLTKKIASKQLLEIKIKNILKKMENLEDEMLRLRGKAWMIIDDYFPKGSDYENYLDKKIDKKEFKELIVDFEYIP